MSCPGGNDLYINVVAQQVLVGLAQQVATVDIIEVAIGVAVGLNRPMLTERVRDLAAGDIDPRVRRAATEALR